MDCIRPDCGALAQPEGAPCSCDAFEARVQARLSQQRWMFCGGAVALIAAIPVLIRDYGPFLQS